MKTHLPLRIASAFRHILKGIKDEIEYVDITCSPEGITVKGWDPAHTSFFRFDMLQETMKNARGDNAYHFENDPVYCAKVSEMYNCCGDKGPIDLAFNNDKVFIKTNDAYGGEEYEIRLINNLDHDMVDLPDNIEFGIEFIAPVVNEDEGDGGDADAPMNNGARAMDAVGRLKRIRQVYGNVVKKARTFAKGEDMVLRAEKVAEDAYVLKIKMTNPQQNTCDRTIPINVHTINSVGVEYTLSSTLFHRYAKIADSSSMTVPRWCMNNDMPFGMVTHARDDDADPIPGCIFRAFVAPRVDDY